MPLPNLPNLESLAKEYARGYLLRHSIDWLFLTRKQPLKLCFNDTRGSLLSCDYAIIPVPGSQGISLI